MHINIENELLKLKYIGTNKCNKIYTTLESYCLKTNDEYVVFFPYDLQEDINDDFVGLHIRTNYITINDVPIRCLYLSADINVDFSKFIYIAVDFLTDENRVKIMQNPYEWIDQWKNIFGDSLKTKKVYDVIGELYSYKKILEFDKSAVWEGPNGGTHDIICSNCLYEIKSSILKEDTKITINSKFQLSDNKTEKLYFCRLEAKPYCISINSLINELENMKIDIDDIENKLSKLGFPKGNRNRNHTFDILELREYDVNENTFPLISLEDLNGFTRYNNIVNYTLTLDLTSIPYIKNN